MASRNAHSATIEGFGDEWERFDQSKLPKEEANRLFNNYFKIFPWDSLPENAVGFDLGCGSGRWAKLVSPRVGKLYCVDPSSALEVAKRNLVDRPNCEFISATVDTLPFGDGTMDFGYSLGVLHHIPDVQQAIGSCVKKLKAGAPFLLYIYYDLEDRPIWFRIVWKISNIVRVFVSRLPYLLRFFFSQLVAFFVYWPLAKISWCLAKIGIDVDNMPLSMYRNCSFYTMRTDALDRFGTRLEQRFSRDEIGQMMRNAGLKNISFSSEAPYWCAVGYRGN